MGFNNPKRSNDIWLLAKNNGDSIYKSAVQQLNMRFLLTNNEGIEQKIHFPQLPNVSTGKKSLELNAVSDAGLPVQYYIKEGPAEIRDNRILFTRIPPRAKYPVKVTVVAWQYGRGIEPKLRSAEPVAQTFYIYKKQHYHNK